MYVNPWLVLDIVAMLTGVAVATISPSWSIRLGFALQAAWFGGLTVYQLMKAPA